VTTRDEPKVALVTGGSRGLGRNTALHLARNDVRVILTYRRGRASADVGVPDDIGGVIASLLSEENRWITGQCIEASGGMFL
jgi:NAD(P)-dependent dehydrogenase (short-subunit alcohol dehydrogenase family)